jgi:hypothetical protein
MSYYEKLWAASREYKNGIKPPSEANPRAVCSIMTPLHGEHHCGEPHRASAQAEAERITAEELQGQTWQEADLLARRKSDAVTLEMAARLRRETTLSIKLIAARMHLGSSKAANRSLHCYMRRGGLASAGQRQLAI